MSAPSDNGWHLDKRVPLTLIALIVVQTLTLVYVGTTWKEQTDARLVALEIAQSDNVEMRRKQWDAIGANQRLGRDLDAKLAGLDERTRAIAAQTDRILELILKQMERER